MAKNGFKIFDSDMHIMEPPDLWERYIDAEFRSQAPRGRTSENVRDLGTIFPTVPKDSRRTGGTPHRGRNYNKNQEIYRNHAERGWTGVVQLEAMDTEESTSPSCFRRVASASLLSPIKICASPPRWHALITIGCTIFVR